jgi:hypothetical protein
MQRFCIRMQLELGQLQELSLLLSAPFLVMIVSILQLLPGSVFVPGPAQHFLKLLNR